MTTKRLRARALISVVNKTGVVFARELEALASDPVTGGTFKLLRENGIAAIRGRRLHRLPGNDGWPGETASEDPASSAVVIWTVQSWPSAASRRSIWWRSTSTRSPPPWPSPVAPCRTPSRISISAARPWSAARRRTLGCRHRGQRRGLRGGGRQPEERRADLCPTLRRRSRRSNTPPAMTA